MKQVSNYKILENRHIAPNYGELVLTPQNPDTPFPDFKPGQFVQVQVPDSPHTFLRRPISVCDSDTEHRWFSMLIRNAGEGTEHLLKMNEGDILNIIAPLGNGFTLQSMHKDSNTLLVGGGVGIAPMHMLGKSLAAKGVNVSFLEGARSRDMLLLLDRLSSIGNLDVTTDDGSMGLKGVVTDHPIFDNKHFDMIYCCGPAPMMKAVAAVAKRLQTPCEVSLENMMACGVGACLCCVENTVKGNVCVCTEGPVFNIDQLTWQI